MDIKFPADEKSSIFAAELETPTRLESLDFGKHHVPYDTLEMLELESDEYNIKEYATYIMNNRNTKTPKNFTFEDIFCAPGEPIAAFDGNVN